MKTNATYVDPDKYVIEVSIAMTSGDWTKLANQLEDVWPSSELLRQIKDVVQNLQRRVGINDNMEKSY